MRIAWICLVATALIVSQSWRGAAEETEAEKGSGLEKHLVTYLRSSLERARVSLKHKQQMRESGLAALPDLLTAEDEIDKCQLYLRLATEGKLIAGHPIFSELRREFSVPEMGKFMKGGKSDVIAAGILEYLERKLRRAEQASDWAAELYAHARCTELVVLEAKNKVEGLTLLLEAERLNSRKSKG